MDATPNNGGGYDYQFVNTPPDRVFCIICHLPSKDPYLTECCGHVFCKYCLNQTKATRYTACPMCKDERFITFSNKQLDREIRSLCVYCTNKRKGCNWEGELNDINKHLGGCQFEEVACSNKCGMMMQRQHLTSHVEYECPCRNVNCQYCSEFGEYQFIEGHHKEQCVKFPLPCPNKCDVETVPRDGMEAHRKECPLEMIDCEYHDMGCDTKIARKDQQMHDIKTVREHLMLTKVKLTETKDNLASTKDELASTKDGLASTKDELASTKDRLASLEETMQQWIDNSSRGYSDELMAAVRWFIHLSSMAAMTTSGNQVCPVIIKMPGVGKCKQEEIGWYSDPFYTHNEGYKMCLCVYAGGTGKVKGTCLSLYLYLMKGPHDDKLSWPLRGKFVMDMLNQISDSEHHSSSVVYDNGTHDVMAGRVTKGDKAAQGWGKARFICNKTLYKATLKCQFVKDDCAFFQITLLCS